MIQSLKILWNLHQHWLCPGRGRLRKLWLLRNCFLHSCFPRRPCRHNSVSSPWQPWAGPLWPSSSLAATFSSSSWWLIRMSTLSLITDYAWWVCVSSVSLILSSLRPCLAVVTGAQVKSVLIKFCLFFDSSNINRLTRNIVEPEAPTTDKLLYCRESSTDMSLLPQRPGGVEKCKTWMNAKLDASRRCRDASSIFNIQEFLVYTFSYTIMKCVYTRSGLSAPSQSAFKWFHKLQPQIWNKFKSRLGKPNFNS